MPDAPKTFAIETYAKRNVNYLTNMVDEKDVPYFLIFWGENGITEAAHEWPDYTDVMMRQTQAAMMIRHMCGETVPIEAAWYDKALSLLDPETGFMLPPIHPWTAKIDFKLRQRHAVHTFTTQYLDTQADSDRRIVLKMIDGLRAQADRNEFLRGGLGSGYFIKSLMLAARNIGYEPAVHLAGRFVDWMFDESRQFTLDNKLPVGGHVHGDCKCLAGAADYALYVNDPVLYSRVDAIYRYVRSISTNFGFVPEIAERRDDIISCETCTIMDYLGLAVTLANHGHPEYWGDVERTARNHLIESQVADPSWMAADGTRSNTDQSTWHEVGQRMVGGYGGWSSPTHMLAARQRVADGTKSLAFMNCCGGSGTHGMFMVWKNAARVEDGTLSVNMHLDKLLPEAEIRCYQPYQGVLTISLKQSCKVRVRIPEFVDFKEMRAESDRGRIDLRQWGNFAELGDHQAGDTLRITYPLRLREEETVIGNTGFRHYRYRVTWKGDTVVRMEPCEEYRSGYQRGRPTEAPLFYGSDGPGLLYQRGGMLQDVEPEPSPIHLDDGSMDIWYLK